MKTLDGVWVAAVVLASTPAAWAQTLYTGTGDPFPDEQHVLELINRARANPTAEGTRLSIPGGIGEGLTAGEVADIGPRPPLAMNAILLGIARQHSQDMWLRDYFAHETLPPPSPALEPWDRATNAGYIWNQFAENIASGSSHTAGQLEDLLMVDQGYSGRGHRKSLLDINTSPSWLVVREVGVGYYQGTGSKTNIYRDVLTEDFGRRDTVGPFVLGVVYNDANGNNFYDPGEGMQGVTIQLSTGGSFYAVSSYAGGYSFPANTGGSITVQATGGQFGAVIASKTVTPAFPGENVKVDFKLSDAGLADTDGDGMSDAWEIAKFGNLTQTATGDADGDTYSNRAEFNAGTEPMSGASTPTPPTFPAPPSSPPPPSSTPKKSGGGGCGLTGLGVLLPLLLARLRRR